MVARIVARFVITVRLNFFSMGCKDGADLHVHGEIDGFSVLDGIVVKHLHAVVFVQAHHPGMTHGHDVRAALFNHKFQRMTHQSERMVLATMG